MKDQNIQKSEEDNIESSNSSDQYNIIQIIVVVKLSGDQAESKTKEEAAVTWEASGRCCTGQH